MEMVKQTMKRIYKLTPEQLKRKNQLQKERYKLPENKQKHLNAKLRNKYGISLKEYDILYEVQNGVCAICGRSEQLRKKAFPDQRLSVDHNHTTNKVRGKHR